VVAQIRSQVIRGAVLGALASRIGRADDAAEAGAEVAA
jgi:hypothetical protein